MTIKQFIENENYVVILDTNVLLNVYRYSPEFSEFALKCLQTIKNHIILPATVRLEYGKHCKAEFAKMQGRVKNAGNGTADQIKRAKNKILATCTNLERLQFSDVDELRDNLTKKLDELQTVLDDFFQERSGLNLISNLWDDTDYLMNIVDELEQSNSILPSPSQEDIYRWCEEGEVRYKKEIPPGYKDAKNKDGVRKYRDLILWKEVLRFAATQKKNIILVTDDVKVDWWENGSEQLQKQLTAEFTKTGQKIIPFISRDFYAEIASAYDIEKTDAVDIALSMTDGDYCENIADDVFEKIADDLTYSNLNYIDTSSAHIGSEGIEELEITDHELLSAERIDRDNDVVTYQFRYQVTVEGTSYEYWGRDDDTKEVIRSYGTDHVFEGIIIVEVTREADIYLDFEDDSSFETVEIISGDLKETEHNERWDYDEPEYGELGNCPDCGCPLDIENDGGNGFCINCAPNH